MDPSRGNGSFLFPPSAMKTTTRSNWIEDRWLEVQCHEKDEPYMLRFFKRNKQKQDFYVRSDSTIGFNNIRGASYPKIWISTAEDDKNKNYIFMRDTSQKDGVNLHFCRIASSNWQR